MTHVGALDIDIDAVRTKYTEAIDAYRDAACDWLPGGAAPVSILLDDGAAHRLP